MDILINIDVDDLDAGIRFYEQALDLRLKRRLFEGTVAELDGTSTRIYLLRKPDGSSPSLYTDQVRVYRRHWTPVHIDFVVPDVDIAVTRAGLAGANIEGPIQEFPWGRVAALSDPFGNGMCLIEWVGEGYGNIPMMPIPGDVKLD